MPRRAALRALACMSFAAFASCGGVDAPTVVPQSGSARTPTAFGSQIYESDSVARDIGLLARMGAKYVRVSVQVSLSYLDAAIGAATAAGLRVILVSAYAAQPVNVAAYAQDAAQLHARYAASNPIWEIWNEPNLGQYWGGPPNVAAYVDVFLATAKALRAAGATEIWTGGTSGVDLNWLFNLQTRGAFNAANGCAVHSYKPPGFARTEYIQATLLVPAGVRVHTTETCVPSSTNQSDFFSQMWSIHRELNLPTMVWCELRDGGAGSQPPYNEDYGLVSSDYTLKSVYTAAQNAIATQQ
jgi:hypothetical protein